MEKDREQRIIAMAARLNTTVEKVRKLYDAMDMVLDQGFELHEVVKAIDECQKEAEAFGLTLEQYIKLHQHCGTA